MKYLSMLEICEDMDFLIVFSDKLITEPIQTD